MLLVYRYLKIPNKKIIFPTRYVRVETISLFFRIPRDKDSTIISIGAGKGASLQVENEGMKYLVLKL